MSRADDLRRKVHKLRDMLCRGEAALRQAQQELAEELCPFRVGDIIVKGNGRGRLVVTGITPNLHHPWAVTTRKVFGRGMAYRCAPTCHTPVHRLRKCAFGRAKPEDPRIPLIGERYRHFKGATYVVTGIEVDTSGKHYALIILYRRVDDVSGETYRRPAHEWFDLIDRPPYNGPRFTPVED